MSLYLDARGVYRSPALDRLPWLEHCFGTALAGPPAHALTLRQVHSAHVVRADRCGGLEEGDALITATPGLWVAVKTADCVPVFLADHRRHAAAVVHAGWRGVLAGVLPRAIEAMREEFSSRPEDLLAVLGPSIRECCYEVGAEVASLFAGLFPERSGLNGRTRLDLAEALRRQAVAAGLGAEHISTGAPCTACGPPHLCSWRRDRDPDRRMFSGLSIGF